MEQVKSIKALLDAAKPFLAALPNDSAMAKIVAEYVDAERIASGRLSRKNMFYFDALANVAMVRSDQMVEYYTYLASLCENTPVISVDSWDGCENAD